MTLIKDLIDIPDHVDKGQFVLRLTEGVTKPEETVAEYVPTPQLVRCFDDALKQIRDALQNNTSKAIYLHGSFGSGKSHFMAILHLMLMGNSAARSIPELAEVVSTHNDWTQGKKFLLVPYHMIGARNMESGILGGYVDFIRRAHPDAAIPPVYLADGLFAEAQSERDAYGDDAFFQRLNQGSSGGGGWGDLDDIWDADSFDAAVKAPPESEQRLRLISKLLDTVATSYSEMAAGHGEGYLSIDKGLSIISRHAQSLGYDGLILFLDELILWLASHAADLRFVHQEGQKLAKLVEAQTADRPIPIISFVARQRDLSDLVGEAVSGSEKLNFSDALKHWEGRFHTITLEDRNLPVIANKRVIKCSDDARKELDAAFEDAARKAKSVMDILLTSEGDRETFRLVYPFSPALVDTLIGVSSVLQRERTALKVMMQLLVDQRQTLKLGDIVPVGDLFDVIAHGDEAFSQDMAVHFENAKRLYHHKLLPMLERKHGRRDDLQQLPVTDPKRNAFRNDDRLIKTLLLSALVPGVESLRGLNSERLAALNHGTIKTPIPGKEGQEVLKRCREWGGEVGEIRVGEGANPSITVQLSGVDTEAIIAAAAREDNHGNKIRRVRQMLFEQFGIEDANNSFLNFDFTWRNTRRSCEVLFRNIRDLPDTSLQPDNDGWRLIIDFPFDEQNHGPRDDLSKLQEYMESHPEGAKTVVWVPSFLSQAAQRDLALLVILEHVLTGERFADYSGHLSPQDRPAARALLDNQRSQLRQRVMIHLEAAYGLQSVTPGSVDTTHELEPNERFQSLIPGFDPQPPAGGTFAKALNSLLDQALAHEFPAHPMFEADIKKSHLQKVYDNVSQACQTEDGRGPVDRTQRALMRQIANPLELGEMGHDVTHFVLGQRWKNHFTRKAHESGGAITVGLLRRWIDEPRPMGLLKEAQNLVILCFAEQTNHSFHLHGGEAFEPTLTNIPDQAELKQESLPDETDWSIAVDHAGSIFGVSVSQLRKAANVGFLTNEVKARADSAHSACQTYCRQLRERLNASGIDVGSAARMQTATATLTLVENLRNSDAKDVVSTLAAAEIATSESAMGECFSKAGELGDRLDATDWEIISAVSALDDERRGTAAEIHKNVCEALTRDEHVTQLGTTLKSAQSRAVRLLTAQKPISDTEKTPSGVDVPPLDRPEPGVRTVDSGSCDNADADQAKEKIEALAGGLKSNQTLRISLRWQIDEAT